MDVVFSVNASKVFGKAGPVEGARALTLFEYVMLEDMHTNIPAPGMLTLRYVGVRTPAKENRVLVAEPFDAFLLCFLNRARKHFRDVCSPGRAQTKIVAGDILEVVGELTSLVPPGYDVYKESPYLFAFGFLGEAP
jgi:hypothetical protein